MSNFIFISRRAAEFAEVLYGKLDAIVSCRGFGTSCFAGPRPQSHPVGSLRSAVGTLAFSAKNNHVQPSALSAALRDINNFKTNFYGNKN